MLQKRINLPFGLFLSVLLSACETPPPKSPSQSMSVPELSSSSAQLSVGNSPPDSVPSLDPIEQKKKQLDEALLIYEDGRYDDAIAALVALQPTTDLSMSDQVTVHKFLAFSHCVMKRIRQCRANFVFALAIDSTFQLSAAEKGHPVWGKEFINAKNLSRSKRLSNKVQ